MGGEGGWWGWMGSWRQVTASIRTIWRFYEYKKCWSYAQTSLDGLRDVSGWISDSYLPSGALHEPHCPSHDFTCLAKPVLEKQTSQLGLLIQQCMGSVWMWLSAGPIKWNTPSVTFCWFSSIQSHFGNA